MAEPDVKNEKVATETFISGLSYSIASLGAIPLRYDQPRFPSIKRFNPQHFPEKKLLKIGEGKLPNTFALSTFSTIGKASNVLGNASALRDGYNLTTNSGHLMRVLGSAIEIQFQGSIFSNSMNPLIQWIAAVNAYPVVRGLTVFNNGTRVPVRVEIQPQFNWTDPLSRDEQGANGLELMFSIEVQYKAIVYAIEATTRPLEDKALMQLDVDGHPKDAVVEYPLHDEDDWP